jgi:hypothetical protein
MRTEEQRREKNGSLTAMLRANQNEDVCEGRRRLEVLLEPAASCGSPWI